MKKTKLRIFRRIKTYQNSETQNNFSKQGFGSKKWAKRQDKASHPILDKTGKLKKGIKAEIKENEIVFMTNTTYGIYHQQGTEKMPKRQIVGVTKKDIKAHERIITEEIEKDLPSGFTMEI